MDVSTLCLIIFNSAEAERLVQKAANLARGLDAHLIALHAFNPIFFVGGMDAEPMIFSSILEWEERESRKIRSLFEEAIRREDVKGEYRAQKDLYGAESFFLSAGRGADLVLMGPSNSEDRSPDDRTTIQRLIRDFGRPVLVMPGDGGLEGRANRLVIGWTDTREATRAAHDAKLLAAPGAEITIVSIVANASESTPGLSGREDIAAGFDRQGYKVTLMDRPAAADARAEELLRAASESGADLLVTGAFGHSHMYSVFIGAVTRDLLKESQISLLLAH